MNATLSGTAPMLEDRTLHLRRSTGAGAVPLTFGVTNVVCAGYSGRSQEAVQAHVRELLELGLPAPERTPIFFTVSPYLATTATAISVQDGLTSGEVEFVLLSYGGEMYVTCGSDHTHRGFERHSIAGSKQMCSKVLAPDIWPLSEVRPHWDALILRSWATVDGTRELYQEGPLSQILEPERLLEEAKGRLDARTDGTVFMSGTLSTMGGRLVYGDGFSFELHNPVRQRTISHAYDIVLLP